MIIKLRIEQKYIKNEYLVEIISGLCSNFDKNK